MTHLSDLPLDPGRTALLVMDCQNDIVAMLPVPEAEALLERAAAALAGARRACWPVIHVVVAFREGYPEVSPRNPRFSAFKASGRLLAGSEGAAIHPRVAPLAGEPVVTKRRVGAFSTTDLEALLRARDITTLVLAGIATSGVVLSTVRWAADMDYRLIVLEDACADRDPEVHRVLMGKVFPGQAAVLATAMLGEAWRGDA